jgi:hypothetical protein
LTRKAAIKKKISRGRNQGYFSMSSQFTHGKQKLYMEIKKYTDSLKLPLSLAQKSVASFSFLFPFFFLASIRLFKIQFHYSRNKVETSLLNITYNFLSL